MGLRKVKSNLQLFIFIFILLLGTLYFTSYKVFNSYFTSIETSQNERDIDFFIDRIDKAITKVKSITSDYSNWDKTYDFFEGLNDEYIYNNFRHGTTTLEDLNLDFIIFTNKANKILFSKYRSDINLNKQSFENQFFNCLKNYEDVGTIISIDNRYLITVKNPVFESDGQGISNGYIYSGKILDLKYINAISSAYKDVIFLNTKIDKPYRTINKPFLKNIKLHIKYTADHILNYIQINSIHNKYLFTIKATYGRDIIKNGKNILILFNIFITLLLGAVFYLMLKYEKILIKQNHQLDSLVDEKTFELNNTLKKLKIKNEELYKLAHMDVLTRIHNRRSFFDLSKNAIKQTKKLNQTLCILMIDIDKFKTINDTYGHKMGDKVLINFCEIVNSIIDKEYIFGRLGGEEFAITFPNKTIEETEEIAEEIRKTIENTILHLNSHEIKYTASFGLSIYKKNTSIDDTLHQADELLYKAKKAGRNRIIRHRNS